MKRTWITSLLCMAVFSAIILSTGCSGAGNGTPPATTGPLQGQGCGFTTCHGLDLACGANAPEVCTMEYRLGDKCRQYAECTQEDGTCRLVTSREFDVCRACVAACEAQHQNDPGRALTCEEDC